jgi:hypothetical protein
MLVVSRCLALTSVIDPDYATGALKATHYKQAFSPQAGTVLASDSPTQGPMRGHLNPATAIGG